MRIAVGRWQIIEREGVEEPRWTPDPAAAGAPAPLPAKPFRDGPAR